MNDLYFNELKVRLFSAADNANRHADIKDVNRNHVNYGGAISWAQVMRDFGHKVDLPCYEDEGFLRIVKIIIDGEVFIDFEK
jgi:hypothetical protein